MPLYLGLGQGVGGDDLEVVGHVGHGFQLQPLDLHFAGLAVDLLAAGADVRHLHILLRQVVDRCVLSSVLEPGGWYLDPISHCLPSVGLNVWSAVVSALLAGWNDSA